MKFKLSIDFGDMAVAMTRSDDEPTLAYLDCETGEIVFASEDSDDEDLVRELEASDRYYPIERIETREQYEWRLEFVSSVDESDIQDMLDLALRGKGAFGRFHAVVGRYLDIEERWRAFEQGRLKARAIAALEEAGVSADLRMPVRNPSRRDSERVTGVESEHVVGSVGFYDLLLLGAPDGKTELLGGQVCRRLGLPSQSEARAVFKRLARELCEREGIGWRKRFIEGKSAFSLGRFHLEVMPDAVELRVDVAAETWKLFTSS